MSADLTPITIPTTELRERDVIVRMDGHPAVTVPAALRVPGFGDVLRDTWQAIRPILTPCDCPLNPYHRWNCTLTPIWSQTIRDLDTNPHTVIDGALRAPRKAIS